MNSKHASTRGFGRLLATTLVAAALQAGASAQNPECYSDTIPLTATSWFDYLVLPQFDATDRVPTSIEITLEATAQGSARAESTDASPQVIQLYWVADLELRRPDTTTLVTLSLARAFSDNLGPFDGVIDFAGPSGVDHSGLVVYDNDVVMSPPVFLDYSSYMGTGSVMLPINVVNNSVGTGAGGIVMQFVIDVTATATICYHWAPDCNHNGVPDAVDVGSGTSTDYNLNGVPDECDFGFTTFCVGGVACPCGNPSGTGSGQGCRNATDSGAWLHASGIASVAADSLVLTVRNAAPNDFGIFIQNVNTTLFGGIPSYNGVLCLPLDAHLVRHYAPPAVQPTVTDASGTGVNAQALTVGDFLGDTLAGRTLHYQYWYRDTPGYGATCTAGANYSSGLSVTWGL